MTYYVYSHNLINTSKGVSVPFYVGKGKGSRLSLKNTRNVYHQRVVNKYGAENIEIKIWYETPTEQEALDLEKELIGFLKQSNLRLTNLTDGGEGVSGYKFTPEQRKRVSLGHKGQVPWCAGKKFSDELCKKLSDAHKGLPTVWLGRKHSEESKIKIGDSCRGDKGIWFGKHLPAETRAKIALKATGRKHSKETCKKMSEQRKGRQVGEAHPMYGKKHTDEAIKKMSASLKGRVSPMKGKPSVTKGTVWMTDGATKIRVSSDDLPRLLAAGWRKGLK